MKKNVIIAVLLVFLAGCSSLSGATQPVTEIAVEDVKSPEMGGAVIVLERSGGFAGTTEKYTIYPDGRVVAPNGEESMMAEEDVNTLLKDIEDMGFFEMKGSYGMLSTCNDCYTYTLTVQANGEVHTVSAVEGVSGTPDEFWQIIDEVNQLVTQ